MDLSNVKLLAKYRISENRWKSFFAVAVCAAVYTFCGVLPYLLQYKAFAAVPQTVRAILSGTVSVLLSILLCAALRLGREEFFFTLARDGKGRMKSLFSYFVPVKLLRALKGWLLFVFVRGVRVLLLYAPFAVSVAVVRHYLTGGLSVEVLAALCVWCAALFVCSTVFLVHFNSGEFLYFRLLCENGGVSPVEAMKKSRRIMRPAMGRAARLRLSFLPLFLSCILIFPSAFVYRYYKTSVCLAALEGF